MIESDHRRLPNVLDVADKLMPNENDHASVARDAHGAMLIQQGLRAKQLSGEPATSADVLKHLQSNMDGTLGEVVAYALVATNVLGKSGIDQRDLLAQALEYDIDHLRLEGSGQLPREGTIFPQPRQMVGSKVRLAIRREHLAELRGQPAPRGAPLVPRLAV